MLKKPRLHDVCCHFREDTAFFLFPFVFIIIIMHEAIFRVVEVFTKWRVLKRKRTVTYRGHRMGNSIWTEDRDRSTVNGQQLTDCRKRSSNRCLHLVGEKCEFRSQYQEAIIHLSRTTKAWYFCYALRMESWIKIPLLFKAITLGHFGVLNYRCWLVLNEQTMWGWRTKLPFDLCGLQPLVTSPRKYHVPMANIKLLSKTVTVIWPWKLPWFCLLCYPSGDQTYDISVQCLKNFQFLSIAISCSSLYKARRFQTGWQSNFCRNNDWRKIILVQNSKHISVKGVLSSRKIPSKRAGF